jgi:hypothetical protein
MEGFSMRVTGKRSATRTDRGWVITVLQEAGAIRECEEHGWMQDCSATRTPASALDIASKHPPAGLSVQTTVEAVTEVLSSIGYTCPECPDE